MRCVITSMNTVRSGSEERATKVIVAVAKLIQRISLYEQMFDQQRVIEQSRCEVEAALAVTAGTKAERAAFTAAKEAFLGVLKKKTDLSNEADGVWQ